MASTNPTSSTSSSSSAPTHNVDGSTIAPARGFTLSPEARSFFTSYYSTFHHRALSDADIVGLVTAAHDRALPTHPYRCIREYRFSYPRIMRHPRYSALIQQHPSPATLRLLDIGSCMGSDLRQALLHRISPLNILGLELEQDFIDTGLDVLFQDRALLPPTTFIAHNILQPNPTSHPTLKAFLDAQPLDLIYCGSVYHLLQEADTHTLTRHVYSLLPPGGVFFGRTVGSSHASEPNAAAAWNGVGRFLHSKATFTKMAQDVGFVDVEFVETESDVDDTQSGGDQWGFQGGEHKSAFFAFYARKAAAS